MFRTFETLLYSIADNGVCTITLNRPDRLNAINATVMEELAQAFSDAAADDTVRGVILTGSGPKAFAAGADITQFTKLNAETGKIFADKGQAVFNQIEDSAKPVVAAVNGFALGGGCELAMACHLRIASDNARFGQPEVNLGLIPGYGGTQRLPRLVGKGIATELILTAELITAERAAQIGLVNKVVAPVDLLSEAEKLVLTITSKAPIAVSLSLKAIRAAELPLSEGLAEEARLFGESTATEDLQEGVDAFLNKRKPDFKGR